MLGKRAWWKYIIPEKSKSERLALGSWRRSTQQKPEATKTKKGKAASSIYHVSIPYSSHQRRL